MAERLSIDDRVLRAVWRAESPPIAQDIADELDVGLKYVQETLRSLIAEGLVEQAGTRATGRRGPRPACYRVTDAGRARAEDRARIRVRVHYGGSSSFGAAAVAWDGDGRVRGDLDVTWDSTWVSIAHATLRILRAHGSLFPREIRALARVEDYQDPAPFTKVLSVLSRGKFMLRGDGAIVRSQKGEDGAWTDVADGASPPTVSRDTDGRYRATSSAGQLMHALGLLLVRRERDAASQE